MWALSDTFRVGCGGATVLAYSAGGCGMRIRLQHPEGHGKCFSNSSCEESEFRISFTPAADLRLPCAPNVSMRDYAIRLHPRETMRRAGQGLRQRLKFVKRLY